MRTTTTTPHELAAPVGLSARLTAAVMAALFGVLILYGVGFAQPEALHNAAHDGRHAFSFPCH
jgi:cobalt transporter subunit CbtB